MMLSSCTTASYSAVDESRLIEKEKLTVFLHLSIFTRG
jgi:hypothetical protein